MARKRNTVAQAQCSLESAPDPRTQSRGSDSLNLIWGRVTFQNWERVNIKSDQGRQGR